jgi:hypothetical protein
MSVPDPAQPFDEAGDVSVEQGIVLIDGPDGVAISLTPHAARVLGERLIAAAEEARA